MERGRAEPVLVLLSDLYSELDLILISANKPFISSALYYLLTTYSTDYCSNQIVNYFDLRRSFYTKWGLKNTCHSSAYIDYKKTLYYKTTIWKTIYYVYKR